MKRKLLQAFMIMLGTQAILGGGLFLYALFTTRAPFPWITTFSLAAVSVGALVCGLFTAAHFWKDR